VTDSGLLQSEPEWREQTDGQVWDQALASLGGHPLQSALWGEARCRAEGAHYLYLAGYQSGDIVALARVETRRVPLLGRVAWIPRGPVAAAGRVVGPGLHRYLGKCGYMVCASTPWQRVEEAAATKHSPRTIWIDLAPGKEQLLQNLDSQWRYGMRRALREGVQIELASSAGTINSFFELCKTISQTKGFRLPASLALMQQLLAMSSATSQVEAQLFVASHDRHLLAGAFIMRAGTHVHYLWGGVDREHGKLRAGEAVQWSVIEWALAKGCTMYDLEGIDPVNNQGTYQFKKKMGGREVALPPLIARALDWRGLLLLPLIKGR